jgi:hypothetical protein
VTHKEAQDRAAQIVSAHLAYLEVGERDTTTPEFEMFSDLLGKLLQEEDLLAILAHLVHFAGTALRSLAGCRGQSSLELWQSITLELAQ